MAALLSLSYNFIFTFMLATAAGPDSGDAADPVAAPAPPVPVAYVDLARYAGVWYEIVRIPNHFQDQCVRNVTARYELRKDGTIDVTNTCEDKDGHRDHVEGIGKVIDTKTNARLRVSFFSFFGLHRVWGDYWIIGLGDDYEYTVVGTPNRKYGWIMTRSPNPAPEIMEKAWRVVRDQGYDVARFKPSSID